jgi:drug/metabolite transporter (DMT)-like permease
MLRPIALILISISLGIVALLLWRAALVEVGGFQLELSTAGSQLLKLVARWRFWLGVVLLFGVVLISLELYGNEELSRIVPLYSMSYVIIALVGKFYLNENVTATRWVGIAAIMSGVFILVRS